MIIDFHTHIFPEKVAQKALPKLSAVIRHAPSTDGTKSGLLASMKDAGIGCSVILPTVTDPHQFDSILRFSAALNEEVFDGPRLLSLGGIHPDAADYRQQLLLLRDYGFAGFKIHPDYQNADFNDIRYKRILSRATELGLFCITHSGFDPYSPEKVHCTPEMVLEVLRDVAPENLVLAHMGSNGFYDEAERLLAGQPLYFDTAYSILHMDPNQLARMIRTHGADRVLFGTDSPWAGQKEAAEVLRSLSSLTDEEKERIFHGNAKRLLHLS